MATVENLWLAALTKNEDDAGSDNRFNLTINIDGTDVFDQNFVLGWGALGQGHDGLEQAQAGLEDSGPLPTPIDTTALTNSSIRLGIRGNDAWAPEHILLFGQAQPVTGAQSQTIALAIETDLTAWLSTDSSEGHLTVPLRLVSPGSSSTVIHRVLLLVYTHSASNVETDNPIELQIVAGGNLVLLQRVTDTPQADLEQYTANWYFLDVISPFTRGDVPPDDGIKLRILGTDAWLPHSVFVFGFDRAMGRPDDVVTLVSIPEWNLGWLSTDPKEGRDFYPLPVSI